MLNFIRFDLWKLFKLKSLWLTVLIFAGVMGLDVFFVSQELNVPYDTYLARIEENNQRASEQDASEDTGLSVTYAYQEPMTESEYQEQQVFMHDQAAFNPSYRDSLSLIPMFAFIFFALFLSLDFTSGFLKNMLSLRRAKMRWLSRKLVIAGVFLLSMGVVATLYALMMNYLANGHPLTGIDWGQAFSYTLLYSLLSMIIMLFVLFIQLTTQSRSFTLIIATLFATNLHSTLIHQLSNWSQISLDPFLFSNQLRMLPAELHLDSTLGNALLVGMITLGILYLINYYRIYHMDFSFDQ